MKAMLGMKVRGVVAVAVAWVAGLAGAAEAPDYSQGFAKLLALGLPSAAGATYVRLSASVSGAMDMLAYQGGRGRRLRLRGNAWLLSESKDGPSHLIAGQVQLVEVWERKAWMAKQATAAKPETPGAPVEAADFGGFGGGPSVGTWTRADLDQDIAAILAYLAPPAAPAEAPASAEGDEGDEGDEGLEEANALLQQACGSFFLFAAHCHSLGRTREANQIVQALFSRVPDRKQVVGAALQALANAQYDEHRKAFARGGDWSAWAEALDALEARFRGAWNCAPGVKRLAGEVRQRATARPPAITGDGITPEDSALAEALAEVRGPAASRAYAMARYQVSLLPAERPTPAGTDPIARIQARGLEALPLLAALAADTYWTPLFEGGASMGYRPPVDDFDLNLTVAGGSEDARADIGYRSLTRPVTRGQIATVLLAAVVPTGDDADAGQLWGPGMYGMPGGGDPEAQKERAQRLAEAARAWQAEAKGKTPLQLAELYLQKGNESQRQQALQYLLASGGEAAYPAVEAAILRGAQGDDTSSLVWMAQEYVRRRGPGAKAFVDKLAALVGAPAPAAAGAPAQGAAPGMFVAGGMDRDSWSTQVLPRLQRLVSPQPLSEVLAEVKAGKRPLAEAMEAIQSQPAAEKPEELLHTFLQLAVDSPDAAARSQILMSCMGLRYLGMAARSAPPTGPAGAPEELPKLDPKAAADLWRTLLADERPVGDEAGYYGLAYAPGVRDLAAMVIEALYGDPESMQDGSMGMTMTLGPRFSELLRTRAAARLEGKPEEELPPLPDASRVPKERRAELLAALRTAEAAALPAVTAKLTVDEMIAVGEELQTDPALNPRLLPAANRIVAVTIDLPGTAAAAPLAALQGQPLTLDAVKRVHQLCLDLTKAGRYVDAHISRAPALGGVALRLGDRPKPRQQPSRGRGNEEELDAYRRAMQNLARVQGSCMAMSPDQEFEPSGATWQVDVAVAAEAQPAPAAKADGDRLANQDAAIEDMLQREAESANDPDQQAAFWESVGHLCSGAGGVWCPAAISFQCRNRAEEYGGVFGEAVRR